MKVLAREGLLVMEPRRGCCVAAIGVEGVARLFDVLELLEIQLVREAARHEIVAHSAPSGCVANFAFSRVRLTGGHTYAASAAKISKALAPLARI